MKEPLVLILLLILGTPILVAVILFLVFRSVNQAAARERAALVSEGIVLDSGMTWIAVRFRNFRMPRFYRGVGYTRAWSSVLLTRERLVFTTGLRAGYFRFLRKDLGLFSVSVTEDGALRIHSDHPPGATGAIDFRVKVSDPSSWVKALCEAGATPETPG